MGSATDDVFTGKEPVTPAEAADVVERLQEQHGCLGVFDSVFLDSDFLGLLPDIGQEFAVREGTVGTELVQDFSQGGLGHGDLAEVVEEGDLWMVS